MVLHIITFRAYDEYASMDVRMNWYGTGDTLTQEEINAAIRSELQYMRWTMATVRNIETYKY